MNIHNENLNRQYSGKAIKLEMDKPKYSKCILQFQIHANGILQCVQYLTNTVVYFISNCSFPN